MLQERGGLKGDIRCTERRRGYDLKSKQEIPDTKNGRENDCEKEGRVRIVGGGRSGQQWM